MHTQVNSICGTETNIILPHWLFSESFNHLVSSWAIYDSGNFNSRAQVSFSVLNVHRHY